MKRNYITPNTISEAFRTEYLCQTAVGSVHSEENLQYGGGSDGTNPNERPF